MWILKAFCLWTFALGAVQSRPQQEEDGQEVAKDGQKVARDGHRDTESCINRNINKPLKNLCVSPECIEASNRLFQNMDPTTDPCQDFNQVHPLTHFFCN